MACIDKYHKRIDVWIVDSGCSKNMKSIKSLFQVLVKKQKKQVQLVNAKELQVEVKDTVGVESRHDIVKMLNIVHFVPNLGYNFFSFGQPMSNEHSLLFWFDDNACVVMIIQAKRFASL